MFGDSIETTSLCIVEEDSAGQIWLNRLADIVNDNLVVPQIIEEAPHYFENRSHIYYNDGPSKNGIIGVWTWTAEPNRNNPDTDFIQSHYQPKYSPIRVFPVPNISTDEQLLEKLRKGIPGFDYDSDTLFVYPKQKGRYRGALCKKNDISAQDGKIAVSKKLYMLPVFEIEENDILYIRNYLRILKRLSLKKPITYLTIGNANEIIKTLLLAWSRRLNSMKRSETTQ